MSRFANLEFGGESEDQWHDAMPVTKDEAWYCAQALESFQNGNFESGLRLYSKVLEFNPPNTSASTGQVRMLIEPIEATAAHFFLWLELAQCQRALGLVGPARHSLAQAQQLNPRCHEVSRELARLSESGVWSRLRGLWRRLT